MKYTIHTHGQSSSLCLVILSYFPQLHKAALFVWFVMDTPLPPTHPDECKYTCPVGGTFVMMWSLPVAKLMWSVISWDTLEHWATQNHLWIREYSNTLFVYTLCNSLCVESQLWDTLCPTDMEWIVPTIFSWIRLTVLTVIIWWYCSVATSFTLDPLDHVYETEMKFLWSAVSHRLALCYNCCDVHTLKINEELGKLWGRW